VGHLRHHPAAHRCALSAALRVCSCPRWRESRCSWEAAVELLPQSSPAQMVSRLRGSATASKPSYDSSPHVPRLFAVLALQLKAPSGCVCWHRRRSCRPAGSSPIPAPDVETSSASHTISRTQIPFCSNARWQQRLRVRDNCRLCAIEASHPPHPAVGLHRTFQRHTKVSKLCSYSLVYTADLAEQAPR
jgi:hypothetical protein